MADERRRRQPPKDEVRIRWLLGTLNGMKRYQQRLEHELAAAAKQAGLDLQELVGQAHAREPAELETIAEQLDHMHYDLVAIRAHLDIPNPGCAPAEEHTEA
jgi:hypothetical protein